MLKLLVWSDTSTHMQALERLEKVTEPHVRLLTTILCTLSLFIFAVAIIDWQFAASLVGVEKMGMEYVNLEGQRAYAYEVCVRRLLERFLQY